MPNPGMRDARAKLAPNPVFTTDANGNRTGDRPHVGPAAPDVVHAALQAQDALAKSPRPIAQSQIGAEPASPAQTDPATRDLTVGTAAARLRNRGMQIDKQIDDAGG